MHTSIMIEPFPPAFPKYSHRALISISLYYLRCQVAKN